MKSTWIPWGRKPVTVKYNDDISRLNWRQFEHSVADWYSDRGYEVEHRGTAARRGTDGGVDLVIKRGGRRVLVQCKHENKYQVPYNPGAQLAALVRGDSDVPADGAILIVSGEFSDRALEVAARLPELTLIDGAKWREMLLTATEQPPLLHRLQELAIVETLAAPPLLQPTSLPVRTTQSVSSRSLRARPPVATRRRSPAMPRGIAIGCLLACVMAIGFIAQRWWGDSNLTGNAASSAPSLSPSPAVPDQTGATGHSDAQGHEARAKHQSRSETVANARPNGQTPVRKSASHGAAPKPMPMDIATPSHVGSTTDAAADSSEIYRSANMSDEEFAAWKQRRASRGPAAPDGYPLREPPADLHDNPRSDVSPEAMKVILRTNRP